MSWQPPNTAPKDKLFLGDLGYPWAVLCIWDAESFKWATTSLHCEGHNEKGESGNAWFETEYEPEDALLRWTELPPLPSWKIRE